MKKNCKLLTILMMVVFALTGCDQNPEEEVVLKGITLDTTNVKTEFTVGDEFTTDGLVVTAAYSDETTKTVDGWTATGNDLSKPAESQEITITYAEDEVEVSASYTIVVKAKAAGGDPEPEPEPEPEPAPLPAKIDLKFNTSYKSNVLVEIFGNYYVSDKSNENYKDYSVCKNTALSDSLIQLKIENHTEDYSVTINDAKTTVAEGKIALSDILKNTIFGKNTIKVLKGEEVIDSAEYTVETGYYDCLAPALKIVTKEGSSGEVNESHVIKAGENLRYGVKAGTSSKVEFEVVQEDGNEYLSNIKTSFKIEDGEIKNVEKNLVTFDGKSKSTIKVTVSAEVPEKYNKPGANYVITASFTTKYDIDTGYVKCEKVAEYNYKLSYAEDGVNFMTLEEDMIKPSIYCFDEYGDIYYTGNSEIGYSINKYSVNTKTSTNLDEVNFCMTLSYDYENSTLYCLNKSHIGDEMSIICGETNKNYSISAYEGKNISNINRIAVKDGNLYVWYEDTNALYKYTMNISDTEIKLENEESYHFPANIKTVENGNVTVNDMNIIDDDIYLAVAFGEDYDDYFEVYNKTINYVTESRGCILKFNTLKNEFDVTGLYEDKHECYSGDYTAYCNGILSMKGNGSPILYYDETLQNLVKIKIKMISYEPELNDSKYLGYVLKFAAIKPKKLICNQNRNFIYADDDGSINIKKINAYSSVDLYDFAIKDSYEKINEEIIDTSFDDCAPIIVFEQDTTLYYLNNCELTDSNEFKHFYIN